MEANMKCTITRAEVAAELGTSPLRVTALIMQGKLPIGIVDDSGERVRTIIPRERWEAWKKGKDMKGGEPQEED
jgi:hypothetical protein